MVCDGILRSISKPFRYVGGEVGSQSKEWNAAKARFCLVYPDMYELGSSHLGLSILYHVINGCDQMLAHRCFAPARDMEDALKKNDQTLFSLEEGRPLFDFDVVGVTLSYELTYTNILAILDLSKIPMRSKDRDDSHPIVIAGGPCAFNPEPVVDFFDAVVLGDGEDVILKIGEVVKKHRKNRSKILEELAKLRGVYVPEYFYPHPTLPPRGGGDLAVTVSKTLPHDLNSSVFFPPLVPHRATHERAIVEVARGCRNGCRFCQAGFTYRPWRERDGQKIVDAAISRIQGSGYDELSLLSLSLGDLSTLEDVVTKISKIPLNNPFNLSLPSLRAEAMTNALLENMGKDRSGSFTLAPEAGTERMRRIINKGNTDADLYQSVEKIFRLGWHQIKLYFMMGLPFEMEEDLDGIVDVAYNCLEVGKKYNRRASITVSTSTFVPKPHTPFQWSRQISIEETKQKQNYLKSKLKNPGIRYKWHKPEISFLEGVFSRGGRELSSVIEKAFDLGCRFDGWDEEFNFERWMKVFDECGIDPHLYLNEKDVGHLLPWSHLFAELKNEYLLEEWARAKNCLTTPPCNIGICRKCGLCGSS